MRSQKHVAESPARAPDARAGTPGVVHRIGSGFRAVIDWVRSGYADEAPVQGHSSLVALNGPTALTPKQEAEIIDQLDGRPSDSLDVDVAITTVTGRLPTPGQAAKVIRALDA